MTWIEGPLLGFDTETTGVDVDSDRIVSAALVRRENGTTTTRTWLIDPGVEIPPAASAIHGITTERARADGQPPRSALDEIAEALAAVLRAGVPVVAYNASFDLTLLDVELRRHGLATLDARLGHPVRPVIDPLVIDRAVDRYRRGKRTLGALCEHYEAIPGADGLHTADVDVVATLDVLAAILVRHPQVARMTLDALHGHQEAAHRRWAEEFNSWRAGKGLEGPGAELTWPDRGPLVVVAAAEALVEP